MRVLFACGYPRDERLGTSRVPMRLIPELERLGLEVDSVFSEDLPTRLGGRALQLTSAARMARALWRRAATADVVDITGSDVWLYAAWARRRRPWQAIVARSNGLWDRVLAAEPPAQRTPWRRLASRVYQHQILCRAERGSLRAADVALFLSAADGRDVVGRGWRAAQDVAVVNPGVDAFFDSPTALEQRKGVAFVGTFTRRKGSDLVAAAMSRVLRERPELTFHLFGTGVSRADVLAAFDPAVRERVSIAPSLSPDELARHLRELAVFAFPTRYEGFGIVVVEAMQAGLAVVTTATGAGVDVVRDGENGLVIPMDSADALASAVGRLLDDPALRVHLARAAVEATRDRSWARAAREVRAVYERAIAIAARPRALGPIQQGP